jgi:phosphatidylglycerol---prolipoprotein diacylglyceryl transferase
MFPTINIGPVVLPTAGLLYLVGAWLALSGVERAARRLGQRPESVYGVAVTVLFAGLIGARLVFVALYWPAYQNNPLGILWPINTGFNVWGGLLIGGAAAFFYGRYHRLAPAPTLDALAPGLLLALVFVSLADFLAGPGYGKLTAMPWGINHFGVRRHPVQLYEIGVGLAALAAWWRVTVRPAPAGRPFLLALAVYSSGRLFVEAFRDNAWLTSSGYHIVQIIALAGLLVALFLLGRLAERPLADAALDAPPGSEAVATSLPDNAP